MNTRFFTNQEENTLLKKIEGVFEHRDIHFFDVLVGYFYASGYFSIRKHIENAKEIRILAGINIDFLVYQAHQQGVLFDANQEKAESLFFNELKRNIQEASYEKDVEEGIVQMIQDISSGKVKVRIHPRKNIHAKIYIFREKQKHEHGYGSVITGSSNLTEAGLSRNFEFNVELRDDVDIDFATKTFEKLWEDSKSIDIDSIKKLSQETFLNESYSPYEVYLKLLIEYFGKSIEFDPSAITDLPKGFKKLSYQIDAVNDGYNKMIKHNGFFLADVVGLGKTIVAILIAKKYFYTNGFPEYRSRTLIIVPPALKDNWSETVDKFNLDNVKIVTNGSLHKIKDATRYDLIIVDEAHKFRSDTAIMYKELQKICKAPTRRRQTDNTYVPKRVILVSATPLNNRPEDIANQLYLFIDSREAPSLEIGNLQRFFRVQIDLYRKLKDEPNIALVQEGVRKIYERIRTKVIEPLIVRRTRTDLLTHDLYSKDLIKQEVKFPVVRKPEKIFYQLEPHLEELYDYTIEIISHPLKGLTYNRYRAIGFLKPHKKIKYKQAEMISGQLAKIMKSLLVKRIDSSFHAFKQSLKRFLDATDAMVKMFDNGKIFIAPNLPVTEYINDERVDELLDMILERTLTDPTIDICVPDDFEPGFYQGLIKDLELLKKLNDKWSKITEDPKLEVFVQYLKTRLLSHGINPQSKLVVFSESQETTEYLLKELVKLLPYRFISVDSKTRKDRMEAVRANFDENIPANEQRNDIDIILSTEVLAEGVNLHRSNVVVNYDTPWNSTRLMQRIGRVNRIGSKAPHIHIFNFYPTAKVNSDIELEKRAIMKLQAFHAALGEDSQIYSPDEVTESFGLFDKSVEEEKDEKLNYLMMIRELKEKTPGLFKTIKNMPLRARTGRHNNELSSSTICYIKDLKRDAFIHVKENGEFDELTFLEAVKIYEADKFEKGTSLHNQHHAQVQTALARFSELLEQEKARDKKVDTAQGPNEKRAISYLDGMLKLPFVSEDERVLIIKAKEAIRKGRFQNLQRDINKFQRSLKALPLNAAVALEKVVNILKAYPIQDMEESETNEPIPITAIPSNPEIIITESFIN